MKKIKLISMLLFITTVANVNAQCYIAASITSTSIGSPGARQTVGTGCDLLEVGQDEVIAVYAWSVQGASDSYFAWQLNWGTVYSLLLNDAAAQDPDVALVYEYGTDTAIYAVVAYRESSNGYAAYEVYKWTGTAFVLYTGSTVLAPVFSSAVVTSAIHVDGDRQGHVVIVFDETSTLNYINYSCGDIDMASAGDPLSIDAASQNIDLASAFPTHSNIFVSHPDVSIVAIDPESSRDGAIVCF